MKKIVFLLAIFCSCSHHQQDIKTSSEIVSIAPDGKEFIAAPPTDIDKILLKY
jgi:hypothetical protein